jgi:hypothetical protein
MVVAVVLLGFSASGNLFAQGTNESSINLNITPSGSEGQITYNEAVSLSIWLRDYQENGISATVSYTVDGTNKSVVTPSSGLAYVNLGQLRIGTHSITASYAGNSIYTSSTRSLSFAVADAPFQFVGAQGTTLFADGTVSNVEGVAVDADDNLCVSDMAQNFVKKEDAFGNITTIPLTGLSKPIGLAGVNSGSFTATEGGMASIFLLWGNGIGPAAVFSPGVSYQNISGAAVIGGVALDIAGNSYISDTQNNTVQKVTSQFVTSTLGFTGLNGPTQLAVDGAGAIYVLDSGSGDIVRLDTAGNETVAYAPSGEGLNIMPSAFAIDGDGELVLAGPGDSGYSVYYAGKDVADNLPMVTAVAIDAAGYIYAADVDGNLTRIAPDRGSKTLASGLNKPVAMAVDASETVYVAESESGTIQLIHSDGSTGSLPISNLTDAASLWMNGFGNLLAGDQTSLQVLYLDRTRQNYSFLC